MAPKIDEVRIHRRIVIIVDDRGGNNGRMKLRRENWFPNPDPNCLLIWRWIEHTLLDTNIYSYERPKSLNESNRLSNDHQSYWYFAQNARCY